MMQLVLKNFTTDNFESIHNTCAGLITASGHRSCLFEQKSDAGLAESHTRDFGHTSQIRTILRAR